MLLLSLRRCHPKSITTSKVLERGLFKHTWDFLGVRKVDEEE